MHKIGGEFVQRATEGWIEVEMDDGSVVQVQKTSMICVPTASVGPFTRPLTKMPTL
jgi:hypothetical protein